MTAERQPDATGSLTRLWTLDGEPDACDVAVNAGPVTFVFHVTRLFLQRRKLECHLAVDWLPTAPGVDRRALDMPPIGTSPVNLDWRSNSSLDTLRRNLQAYYDPEGSTRAPRFAWPQILQLAAQRVNQFALSPSDFEEANHVEISPAEYLVKPFWPARGVTIWFGQGETNKGYMALGVATAMLYDANFAGLRTRQRNHVYYVDYEEPSKEEFDVRVSRLANGLEVLAAPIKRFNPRGRLFIDTADALRAKIAADGGRSDNACLIIDSALPAVGGEAKDPEPVGAFFNAVHYIGLPTLLIAHDTKEGNEEAPFGSVFWRNLARMCVNFQASTEPGRISGDFVRDVLLRCTKANNVPRFSPLAFQVVFSDDDATMGAPSARPNARTWIRQIDPITVSLELQAKLPVLRRLVAFLRASPGAPVKAIADATGVSADTVYKTLVRNPSVFQAEGGGRGHGNIANWTVV